MSGLTPIANSAVTLHAVGGSYGSGATALGTVATGADGSFDLSSYTCPAGNPQTYITASGGNAGAGANSAIGLMAVLGPCSSLSTSTTIAINELTTAAAQWALAQFFDSSGHTIGAPPTNATGLKNAYSGFANLANIDSNTLAVSGNPSSLLPSPQTCAAGSPPANCDALERLNTLANILAGCVDSAPSSTACAQIFCDATPGLTYSGACSGTPAIADTIGAAHLIVTNPANNVSALYGLAAATAPFSPALGAAPDGWEIGLDFAPASAVFNEPESIALDGSGNVFVANSGSSMGNFGSVSELTAASGYATGLNFAAPAAAFDAPLSVALDGSGNVFVANCGSDCSGTGNSGSVSELTAASSYATGLNFAPSTAEFASPESIALDGSGNVFVANDGNLTTNLGSVSELTAASAYATGLNLAPPGAGFDFLVSIALDGSGNVFGANYGNSVTELTAASSYDTGFNFSPPAAKLRNPGSITLDGSGNVFVANIDGGGNFSVSELTASSSYATGLNFDPEGAELDYPFAIAVDGSGNVFVANEIGDSNNGSVSELSAASSYASGLNFAPSGASFNNPVSIAVDGSGNVFAANYDGVSEILGLAKPVITPVQSCLNFWSSHPGQACVP